MFPNAATQTLFPSQVEYKYDKENMKGCVIPVVDDKLTLLALKNNEMNSYVSRVLLYYCTKRRLLLNRISNFPSGEIQRQV